MRIDLLAQFAENSLASVRPRTNEINHNSVTTHITRMTNRRGEDDLQGGPYHHRRHYKRGTQLLEIHPDVLPDGALCEADVGARALPPKGAGGKGDGQERKKKKGTHCLYFLKIKMR